MDSNSKKGSDLVLEKLKHMPSSSGVYQMINDKAEIIYVGKAKNLKKRITAYSKPFAHVSRINRMISQITDIQIIETRSEAEALLLEANLIKKFSPKYNVLLRDDKSFPYIAINKSHPYPKISKHRGARAKNEEYFGPFASAGAVDRTINVIQRVFLLRSCTDNVFDNRVRPCLLYQIKRCSAPCVEKISKEDYALLINETRKFLSGEARDIQKSLEKEMATSAENMEYEKAAIIRDRIQALTQIQSEHKINFDSIGDADIFAFYREGHFSVVQLFIFRGGQNYGSKSYFPSHAHDAEDSEIFEATLGRFYQTSKPPKEIILNKEINELKVLEEALTILAGYKVSINIPVRGDKVKAIKIAEMNAKESLQRKMQESAAQEVLMQQIGDLFGLDFPPDRIEVYDNSHIMGTNQIGAMIVASKQGFEKKHYRKFNIKNSKGGDDYAMMREVFSRRFANYNNTIDGDEKETPKPDLILIDGGLGQLNAVASVLEDMGINDIPYVAIAKGVDRNAGREQFFIKDKEPFTLPINDHRLFYLQRLRDEAHRFAIGSHRKKRSASTIKSELDMISGIGSSRKKILLRHFGSVKAIERASLEDIASVEGINKKIAEVIFKHFHG